MRKKNLHLLLVALCFLTLIPAASAGEDKDFIGVTSRFMWQNTSVPLLANPNIQLENPVFSAPTISPAIHYGFLNNLSVFLGLDLGMVKVTTYPFGKNNPTSEDWNDVSEVTYNFFRFGFDVGAKYHFTKIEPEKIAPYLSFDFFLYFATAGNDYPYDPSKNKDQKAQYAEMKKFLDYVGSMQSPLGFDLAFGVDYWFNRTFGIGADILGLRLAYASSSLSQKADNEYPDVTWDGSQSQLDLGIYSAIVLSFRFFPFEEEAAAEKPAAPEGGEWGTQQGQQPAWTPPPQQQPAPPQPAWGQQPGQQPAWGQQPQPVPPPPDQTPPPAPDAGWGTTPPPPPPPPPPPQSR